MLSDQINEPRARPPLVPCPAPTDLLPEGGVEVNDLRSFLLELTASPARLRQNQTLFQKEHERFTSVLDALPAWGADFLRLSIDHRLNNILRWCRTLGLARAASRSGTALLELSRDGQKWLASDLAGQYTRLFDHLCTGRAA
ncbi:MAG TPA: hypothetical protein VKD72_22120, partial [Gemmataceae bacterium]|nr:hypothetical protein [Gemmataceae bacterium]